MSPTHTHTSAQHPTLHAALLCSVLTSDHNPRLNLSSVREPSCAGPTLGEAQVGQAPRSCQEDGPLSQQQWCPPSLFCAKHRARHREGSISPPRDPVLLTLKLQHLRRYTWPGLRVPPCGPGPTGSLVTITATQTTLSLDGTASTTVATSLSLVSPNLWIQTLRMGGNSSFCDVI